MKTQTSRKTIWFRSLLLVPVLSILLFSFSSKKEIELLPETKLEIQTELFPIINGIECKNCEINLTSKAFENTFLDTNKGEKVKEFKIKFPGKPTETIKGNRLNKIAKEYLKASKNGTLAQIFNIKTEKQIIKYHIIIKLASKANNKHSNSPLIEKDEELNIYPPPTPPKPPHTSNHIVLMAEKGADFYYNGDKITSDKANELVNKNSKMNISSQTNNGKSTVHLSEKGMTIVNGEAKTMRLKTHEKATAQRKKAMQERKNELLKTKKEAMAQKKESIKERSAIRKSVLEERKNAMMEHRKNSQKPIAQRFKGMEKQGTTFYYDGEKISEEKAIALVNKHKKINISMQNNNGKSTVHLSKKGMTIVNGEMKKN